MLCMLEKTEFYLHTINSNSTGRTALLSRRLQCDRNIRLIHYNVMVSLSRKHLQSHPVLLKRSRPRTREARLRHQLRCPGKHTPCTRKGQQSGPHSPWSGSNIHCEACVSDGALRYSRARPSGGRRRGQRAARTVPLHRAQASTS